MASSLVNSKKSMKRLESKKSHSWWWDSHISPKNSKWLAENLEEMDQHVKQMLKLIEGDGESFAKKAEMYFQRRPELINLVEEFYRMYRALAERYDIVTGELRKSLASDLQSHGSGFSDAGSESSPASPSLVERRRRKARMSGSESDSDDYSDNNYSGVSVDGDDQDLRRRIAELEAELCNVKEKLQLQKGDNSDGSFQETKSNNSDVFTKISVYEEELRTANEKILVSEKEIAALSFERQKCKCSEYANQMHGLSSDVEETEKQTTEFQKKIDDLEAEISKSDQKTNEVEEELAITRQKLHDSEKEVASLRLEYENNKSYTEHLQQQIESLQKNFYMLNMKLGNGEREVLTLTDQIAKNITNLSERDEEIRGLKETISNSNKSLSVKISLLQDEITSLSKEKTHLEDKLKDRDLHCQALEKDIKHLKDEKTDMETALQAEIQQLKADIAEKDVQIEVLNQNSSAFNLKYTSLATQRDELNAKVATLIAELRTRDDKIEEMSKHLHQLHIEHVKLSAGMEAAEKVVGELTSSVKELENKVERQQQVIEDGAEEKREAIRQLCCTLEHYRNGYHRLRQAFVAVGRKGLPVMAS